MNLSNAQQKNLDNLIARGGSVTFKLTTRWGYKCEVKGFDIRTLNALEAKGLVTFTKTETGCVFALVGAESKPTAEVAPMTQVEEWCHEAYIRAFDATFNEGASEAAAERAGINAFNAELAKWRRIAGL